MHQTRRQFVGTAAAIGALTLIPGRAATPSGPRRQSLAAFSADPVRVAVLRRGVAAMKALPASNPGSWFFQAATHAYSDALLKAELKRDPKLQAFDRDKYWNKCPHFGQCSADFAIWHRAFLHFFERTLRAASGDPTFALPYWDYGNAEQRVFPAVYAPEFVDNAKTIANPLFHPNREESFARGLLEISGAIGEAPKTVGAATFFHQPGVLGFGGDTLDSDHTQIGLLEQRPHNDIHLAVGGVIDSANGAMAEITTAAFDPVFWVHHANIDRMWAQWAATPGKSWGIAQSQDWFDERPWTFVDADGSDVTLSRREAIELPVAYDVDYGPQLPVPASPPPPPPPKSVAAAASGAGSADSAAVQAAPAPPPVGAAPPVALGAAAPSDEVVAAEGRRTHTARRRPRERELLADSHPITVTPHSGAHRQIGGARSAAAAHRDTRPASEAAPAAPTLDAPELSDAGATVLLELSGISFTLVPSSGFAVYLDRAGKPTSADPVGLIDIFGATHHGAGLDPMPGMHMIKAAQRFDVTAIVRRSPGPFTLRVEPYDLLVTHDGRSVRGRADAVTIESVRFVVLS
ncbi:MAG TPA: tyrosinase family protein [Rhizomicrobium sp.]|jgi:hypothetical protein|nr:tyrosinase family protein [Rhizomicrobium sp.]